MIDRIAKIDAISDIELKALCVFQIYAFKVYGATFYTYHGGVGR